MDTQSFSMMLLLLFITFFGTTCMGRHGDQKNVLTFADKDTSISLETSASVSQGQVLPQSGVKRMPLVSMRSRAESKSFNVHGSAESSPTTAQKQQYVRKHIESAAATGQKKDVISNAGETTPRKSPVITDPNSGQPTDLERTQVVSDSKSNPSAGQYKKQVLHYTESKQHFVSEQEQMPKYIKQIHITLPDQPAFNNVSKDKPAPSNGESREGREEEHRALHHSESNYRQTSSVIAHQSQVLNYTDSGHENVHSQPLVSNEDSSHAQRDQTSAQELEQMLNVTDFSRKISQEEHRLNFTQTGNQQKIMNNNKSSQIITKKPPAPNYMESKHRTFQEQLIHGYAKSEHTTTEKQVAISHIESTHSMAQEKYMTNHTEPSQSMAQGQSMHSKAKSSQIIVQVQTLIPKQQIDTDLKSGHTADQHWETSVPVKSTQGPQWPISKHPVVPNSVENAETVFYKHHENNGIPSSGSDKLEKKFNIPVSVSMLTNSSRKIKTDTGRCTINVVNSDTIANCSYRNLTTLPEDGIPYTVTHLLIQGNFLTKLRNNSFTNYTLLRVLDLSRNALSEVEEFAFSGLENLIVLNLTHNSLKMTNDTFPENIFRSLIRLEELKINKNNNSCKYPDGLDYPDRALSHLRSLKKLSMDGLYNKDFGPGFQNLTSLVNLSMAGFDTGCCKMNQLTNVTFRYLSQLKHLNISKCYIKGNYIDREAFSPLQNLVSLDLTHNEDIDIENLDNTFYSLRNITTLKELRMKLIVNRYSIGICLDSSHIRNFPPHLEYFDAQENNLEGLDRHVIELLSPSLKTLDVSGNKFVFGTYLQDLHLMKNLTKLKINGGGFVYKFPDLFPFQVSFKGSGSNCTLYGQQDASVGNYTKFTLTLPPNLKTIEMNGAGLQYILSNLTIDPQNKLENLSMNKNNFPRLTGPFVGLNRLIYLDVSSSYVENISDVFFINLTSLKTLRLGGNLLGDFFLKEESSKVFQPLKYLNHLDLSFNDIRSFPTNVFSGLGNLSTLLLKKNPIQEFNMDISNMNNLTLLNLTRSRLSRLPIHVMQHIDKLISRGQKVVIDMSQCPISCSCPHLDFLIWMKTSGAFVNISSSYLCLYADDSSRYITDGYNSTIEDLTRECSSNTLLFLFVAGAMFIVFCIILFSVLYRFRWKLRYLYYAAHLFYRSTKQSKQTTEYEYDAFISYDEADEQFVVGKMSQELEKRGLKLCIHGRDFRAGEYIASNIVRAVCGSRRTVVVLTHHMVSSYWCKYEIQMANMEAVYTGRKVLLFLLMETIPDDALGVELLYYIRNSTYIPYPKDLPDATSIGKLWDKLVADIRD